MDNINVDPEIHFSDHSNTNAISASLASKLSFGHLMPPAFSKLIYSYTAESQAPIELIFSKTEVWLNEGKSKIHYRPSQNKISKNGSPQSMRQMLQFVDRVLEIVNDNRFEIKFAQ